MRCALLYLSLTLIPLAQAAVADWFPLHIGDTWEYDHETRDDSGHGPANPEIHLWRTEETIIGRWTIPEGTLIGSHLRVIKGTQPSWWQLKPVVLIRGDCLYRLSARDWDSAAHQLTANFRHSLDVGEIAPDLCFPLAVSKAWGAPASKADDWKVEDVNQNIFHIRSISSYLGSGMTGDLWFEKGVGIIREIEIHHGTLGEVRTRLVVFHHGKSR